MSFGKSVKFGSFVCMPSARQREHEQRAAERASESSGPAQDGADDSAPRTVVAPGGCRRTGSAPVDPVAEPVQHRGQHRQRADHRDGTTIIVPSPIDVNIALPETNIPAIAISTVTPEISTACPDVAAVRSSASCGARPRCRSSRSRRR